MPYLNWAESSSSTLQQKIVPHARLGSQLELTVSADHLPGLIERLEEVFAAEIGVELRLNLPQEWAIFWKAREQGSRLLLAHPEKDQWVVTAALERTLGQRLITELRALSQPGQHLEISQLVLPVPPSNVEILIRLK